MTKIEEKVMLQVGAKNKKQIMSNFAGTIISMINLQGFVDSVMQQCAAPGLLSDYQQGGYVS